MGHISARWRVIRAAGGMKVLAIAGTAVLTLIAGGAALAASGPPRPAGQVASVAAAGQSRATLRVTAGTPLLVVRMASPGSGTGTLAQAETPSGAPVRPELRETGGKYASVELSLAHAGGSGSGGYPVTVTLSRTVTWALVFAGGTQRTVADLRGGRVAVLIFTAGSDTIDLTLPRPRGSVPVVVAGGASRLLVRVPPGVPARVTAGGGAGTVTIDGTERTGVAGGTVLASSGWPSAGPGVDVDATAGAALISVTRWAR